MEYQREKDKTNVPQPVEIVEVYRQPQPREVVEVYSRPLPWMQKAPKPERQECEPAVYQPLQSGKRKKGLWIFLGFLGVTVCAAICAFLWSRWSGDAREDSRRKDPFEWYREEIVNDTESEDITIPS